ncbi:hypothetical protein EHS25_008479 [Saitozyma podzolica]|uniref:Bacterial surface antigen (D15) domain-containing protein n=1 Tax=Saitozyma podzolica TaxID=1890683 RepID=A0A427YLX9_9TREE|nr:hypothetical protein EHS25_008479 [Saitozyma podzolica]
MDPNAEDGPPRAEIVEVDVDLGESEQPSQFLPIQPPLSSSIFRSALERPQPLPSTPPAAPVSAPPRSPLSPEEEQQSHEEAFQRKLRGEYEAAQTRLGEVVTSNLDRPLRLTAIRLSPQPPTTRPSFLTSLLSPFLAPPNPHTPTWLHPAPPPPESLHDILRTTRALVAHLDRFGIFDMERAGVRLAPVRGGDEDEVELLLALRERGRLFLKAGTEVGGGEGGGNVTARIRNALGGGEAVEMNASIGTKTKSAYQASITTPLLGSPLLSFALSGFSFDRDNTAFASHHENAQGARAKLSAIAPWGTHDLTYEYVRRDITHLAPNASISVREHARPSTKASVIHTWTSDTRDDPWTGTSGRLLKLANEYAGLPGSSDLVHFFKSTLHSHTSRALFQGSNIHYSISSLTTLLFPLSRGTTELPDRTYVGGPNSLRGWKVGGVGLRDGVDSLGGDLSWALGLSLFAPIPKKEHWPLKIHSFLNVGKVVGYQQGEQAFSRL